jgi:hypothetical protein
VSAGDHRDGERDAEHDCDDDGVQRESVGFGHAPSSERARDRGRYAAAHRAGRHHLHEHDDGKHERMKYASMRPIDACTSMTSTFGAASLSSVAVIGPSSSRRVRG